MAEGAGPIEEDQRQNMAIVADALDTVFNGTARGKDRKIAFVVLSARFGDIEGGRVNYISNAERADTISMMKELVARMEGRYSDGTGSQQ
ncbi:MAG TPA: hypothetical protein VGA98_07510 [Allosphingosinicella sp.]|jgi:hypothetical protein